MAEKSNNFDMIGPVKNGLSRLNKAGGVRIAQAAICNRGETLQDATIPLYNFFARTYEGRQSDCAILTGFLDFATYFNRLKDAFTNAAGLNYTFRLLSNASTWHSSTIRQNWKGVNNKEEAGGESQGRGMISIVAVIRPTTHYLACIGQLG